MAGYPLPPGLLVAASGDVIRVAGTPTRAGLQLAALEVRDAAGRTLTEWLSLAVMDVLFQTQQLIDGLVQPNGSALTPSARGYLDDSGNRNGALDLGDLRAYLKRMGRI
ncbi:MAG: hypothetical protein EXR95_06405 [Gemmatimonadetes bacterium]|nr:hypothetical protein [Gemmatimonadota bacterium]